MLGVLISFAYRFRMRPDWSSQKSSPSLLDCENTVKKSPRIVFPAVAVLFGVSAFVGLADDAPDNDKPIFVSNNPKIKQTDAALEKADAKALKAFALAKIKARQKAITDLKEAKSAAMKAEKLDEAIEIKRKIEVLEKEADDAMEAAAPDTGLNSGGGKLNVSDKKEVAKAIIGKWVTNPDVDVQFLANGMVRAHDRQFFGDYKYTIDDAGNILVPGIFSQANLTFRMTDRDKLDVFYASPGKYVKTK